MASLSAHFWAGVTIAKIPIEGIPVYIFSLWLHQGFLPHRVVVYRQRETTSHKQTLGPKQGKGWGITRTSPSVSSSVHKNNSHSC